MHMQRQLQSPGKKILAFEIRAGKSYLQWCIRFSIEDLKKSLISNCKQASIVAIVDIVKSGYPDPSQFNCIAAYFDQKSSKESPKWFSVDVKFNRMLKRAIPINELKELYRKYSKYKEGPLKLFGLFKQPSLPVTKEEYDYLLTLILNETAA